MKKTFACLVIALSLLGCDKRNPVPAPIPKVEQPLTREAFSKLVMGQTDRFIKSTFGPPFLNNNYAGELGILWTYRQVTVDPASGKTDEYATVVFEHGLVTKVAFK